MKLDKKKFTKIRHMFDLRAKLTFICKIELTYVSGLFAFSVLSFVCELVWESHYNNVEIFLDKLIILQSKSSKRTHRELPSSEATLSGICLPA